MFSFSGLPSVRVLSVSIEPFEYTWFTAYVYMLFREYKHPVVSGGHFFK